ncbi:MAG: DUF3558 domain-containing protein [Actinophytocola sp.]|uniref:DUF3558 domain-containing protein n=1 Tax=Actinophytocola sp. TaxID=1872138 RepID=UPI00132A4079|nr:DUF3558 domain-containing protein [Actinophytocola sp.]MPZ80546.1 DUF3558 domain-containing protein [Actinophytocola sp.]
MSDTVKRSVLLLPAMAAALVLGLAGCSEETPGDATPGEETSTSRPTLPGEGTEPSEDTTSTEPDSGESPLAELKPCDIVSADGADQLGLTEEEVADFGDGRVCVWRYEGANVSDSYNVQLELFDEKAIGDVVGTNVKPVPAVGSHEAVTYVDPAGGCAVAIEAGPTSRVDTRVVGGEERKACQLAMQLATLVEPELP